MKIVADKDLPLVEELFSRFGELALLPGRIIENKHLTDADALLVRSTTKVSGELVNNTSLKFVGSATSGVDHISRNELTQRGISFSDAKGCNANAVTDYCLSAIAHLFSEKLKDGNSLRVGIIGNGSIGSLLARKIKVLNWEATICDPPQNEEGIDLPNSIAYQQLEHMNTCDVISIHAPLTTSGKHPTKHLLNKNFLSSLSEDTVLINTSRGGIVEEKSLLEAMNENKRLIAITDVWEAEPFSNADLVEKSCVATPHIAGYSEKAKKAASLMIFTNFCGYFGVDGSELTDRLFERKKLRVLESTRNFPGILDEIFPIMEASSQFKRSVKNQAYLDRASFFDSLRLKFSGRHEFCEYAIPRNMSQKEERFLRAAGFNH